MNDQELQQIEERVNKATNAPWIVEADEYSGRNWLIGCVSVFLGGSAWSDKSYYVTTKGVHASELEGDAKTDAEFIAAARTDVPALIAEVRALRDKLAAVPVDSILYMIDPFADGGTDAATGAAHWQAIDAWAQAEKAKRVPA